MVSEERKKKLLNKIQKLSDYHEIQNEMGRLIAAFNFRQHDRVLSYFCLDQPDVSFEFADEGVFEGEKAEREIVNELIGRPAKPGEMIDMQLTTPMIEVAVDLKTAKALWWCPGAGAIRDNDQSKPNAIWCWGMIGGGFS